MVLNKKNLLMVILLLLLMIIGGIFYLYFFIYSREEITSTSSSSTSSTSPMLFPKPLNPTVNNAKADFGGLNLGDSIQFSWSPADHAQEYVLFRAYSIDGPREGDFRLPASAGTEGVDITPDARLRTLCYWLEAQDDKGLVTKKYEPICIPKYMEED